MSVLDLITVVWSVNAVVIIIYVIVRYVRGKGMEQSWKNKYFENETNSKLLLKVDLIPNCTNIHFFSEHIYSFWLMGSNAKLITVFSGLVSGYANLIIVFSGLISGYAKLKIVFSGLISGYAKLIIVVYGLSSAYAKLIIVFYGLISAYAKLIIAFYGLISGFYKIDNCIFLSDVRNAELSTQNHT